MVRLKPMVSNDSALLQNLSQFHYGSIKTLITLKKPDEKTISLNSTMVRLKQTIAEYIDRKGMSQFHYGSIKTTIDGVEKDLLFVSQFHYGSIKTGNNKSLLINPQDVSQFHYGSIKTTSGSIVISSKSVCLNSTMVRLKLWTSK